MLPLTQVTAPAAPAEAAALAAVLAAGVGVALPLQAPTTNAVASARAPMRLDVEMIDTDPVPPCLSGSPPRGGRPEREPVVRFLNDRLDPRGQPAICGLLTSGQHGPEPDPAAVGQRGGGPAAGRLRRSGASQERSRD